MGEHGAMASPANARVCGAGAPTTRAQATPGNGHGTHTARRKTALFTGHRVFRDRR